MDKLRAIGFFCRTVEAKSFVADHSETASLLMGAPMHIGTLEAVVTGPIPIRSTLIYIIAEATISGASMH